MGYRAMKRKVCVITGTRAEYGILAPVMEAIRSSKHFNLYVVATGMHLMTEFGYTVKEIERDGFSVYAKIDISHAQDKGGAMADGVGRGTSKFVRCFQRLRPDFILTLGDRGEVLAAAVAANYMNIPVVHIHGGEVSGHVDGVVRHAITKLAHIHFPATQKARERILRLGEEPWRVMVAGAPALDRILNDQVMPKQTLLKKYRLDPRQPLGLLVQHPVHSQIKEAGKQIQSTLQAIVDLKLQTVVVYPNADAGGRAMIKVLGKFKKYLFLKHYKSIPHADYLGLLKIASVLIGNSSSGIIEAASFRLPVINIGCRQEGRERSVNVIDVPHEKRIIARVIQKVIHDQKFRRRVKQCRNPYGDGKASGRIVKFLGKVNLNNRLIQKKITY